MIIDAILEAIHVSIEDLSAGRASEEPEAIEIRVAEGFSVDVEHVRRVMGAFSLCGIWR